MFTSSAPFEFFDYFRVPYRVDASPDQRVPHALGHLRVADSAPDAPQLYWCRTGAGRIQGARPGRYRMAGFSLVGNVVSGPPEGPAGLLPGQSRWHTVEPILDLSGRQVSAVWGDTHGNVLLPFDPGELMTFAWAERYTTMGARRLTRGLRKLAIRCYYAVRPLMPRQVQLLARRKFASGQSTPEFPAWPAEHCLHDLYDWLLGLVSDVADGPVPYLSPWPDGKTSAFVLTHDVETWRGRDNIEKLRGPERELGYRSSWNFVPERYETSDEILDGLREEGCEIGVHGLRHDGHDLASARELRRRLPAMRAYAERWGAVGFRSPATQRTWELMPTMGFDYDSSYTDSAPHEPQPGGCCTYLPFFNESLVELPLTLPQDHTLFEILGHTDGQVWLDKAAVVRDRGGMVLLIAHPDYVDCPGMLGAWDDLLRAFAFDETVWRAVPREVSDWWRRRAASIPVPVDGAWTVRGPAADDARVLFAGRAHGGAHRLQRDRRVSDGWLAEGVDADAQAAG